MNAKKMRPSSKLATILVVLLTISFCIFPGIESKRVGISGEEVKMGNEITPMRGKRVHDCSRDEDCKVPKKCSDKCSLTYCKDDQCLCQLRFKFTIPCRPPLF